MKIMKTGLLVVLAIAPLIMSGCASDSSNFESGGVAGTLVGSKWHYSDKDWQYDLEFRPNGVLYTTHPNDDSKNNDTWVQEGMAVRFYYNNKFSSYQGKLSGNNLMSGTATNKNGANWDWKATRAD